MLDTVSRTWKFTALLVVGVGALAAAFFAEGGGQESLEQSAEQIRDRRAAAQAAPAPAIAPPSVGPVAAPTEEIEPEFGAPMDAEPTPVPAKSKPTPAEDGEGGEEPAQPEF